MNGLRSASLAKVLLVSLVLLAAGMLAGSALPGVGTAWADTAGYNAPGFTNYSNLAPIVTGSTALKFGLDWARASAIDPAGGFLYVGMATQPGAIAKLRLSDFTVADTLQLRQGEDLPGVALIDTIHGYLYIGTYTSPAQVIKVSLSDFSRVDALTFEPGENLALYGGVIDAAGGAAYFGLASGHIVKVDLTDFTRVGSVRNPNCPNIAAAAIDTAGGYAYFGSLTTPGTVVRVQLSDFTLAGELPMVGGEGAFASAAVDSAAGFAYFGTNESPSGRIVKIRLSDFTQAGSLTLSGYRECGLDSCVMDSTNGYLYMGTAYGNAPGKVVRIDLSTFSETGALTLPAEDTSLLTAVLDPTTGMAYFGSGTCGAQIAKVQLSTLSHVQSLSLPGGESRAHGCAVDHVSGFAYLVLETEPTKVAKVRLSDMREVGSVTLQTGENDGFCAVITPAGDYVYIGLDVHPGMIVKIRTSDMSRVSTLSTPFLGAAWCGVIDADGASAYFGTYSPGQIVKIDLASFTVTNAMDVLSDEFNVISAAIDPNGEYAYFGTWDNSTPPGQLIKVRLSDFSRVSRATTAGNCVQAIGVDASGTYAYTGSWDSPGKITKVRLSDMTVVRSLTLDPGENDMMGCAVDQQSGHVYFGTALGLGRVVRVRMSDLSRVDTAVVDDGIGIRYAVQPGVTPGSAIAATCSQPSIGRARRVESAQPSPLLESESADSGHAQRCADLLARKYGNALSVPLQRRRDAASPVAERPRGQHDPGRLDYRAGGVGRPGGPDAGRGELLAGLPDRRSERGGRLHDGHNVIGRLRVPSVVPCPSVRHRRSPHLPEQSGLERDHDLRRADAGGGDTHQRRPGQRLDRRGAHGGALGHRFLGSDPRSHACGFAMASAPGHDGERLLGTRLRLRRDDFGADGLHGARRCPGLCVELLLACPLPGQRGELERMVGGDGLLHAGGTGRRQQASHATGERRASGGAAGRVHDVASRHFGFCRPGCGRFANGLAVAPALRGGHVRRGPLRLGRSSLQHAGVRRALDCTDQWQPLLLASLRARLARRVELLVQRDAIPYGSVGRVAHPRGASQCAGGQLRMDDVELEPEPASARLLPAALCVVRRSLDGSGERQCDPGRRMARRGPRASDDVLLPHRRRHGRRGRGRALSRGSGHGRFDPPLHERCPRTSGADNHPDDHDRQRQRHLERRASDRDRLRPLEGNARRRLDDGLDPWFPDSVERDRRDLDGGGDRLGIGDSGGGARVAGGLPGTARGTSL